MPWATCKNKMLVVGFRVFIRKPILCNQIKEFLISKRMQADMCWSFATRANIGHIGQNNFCIQFDTNIVVSVYGNGGVMLYTIHNPAMQQAKTSILRGHAPYVLRLIIFPHTVWMFKPWQHHYCTTKDTKLTNIQHIGHRVRPRCFIGVWL